MVVIELDYNHSGNYGEGKNSINVTTEPYVESNLFFKVTHKLKNSSSWGSTYLTFKSTNTKLNAKYYQFTDTTPFNCVEVYFSSLNQDAPLVLGVITNRSWYFKFSRLKEIYRWTNLATRGGWFGDEQLTENLISENDKINNVITYRLDKINGYNNIIVDQSEENENYSKYTHRPNAGSSDKKSTLLYINSLLELKENYEFTGNKLSDIQKKCYSKIVVFFDENTSERENPSSVNINGNPREDNPILLELNESGELNESNSTSKKHFLQRVNKEGTKWKQIDPPSQQINTEYITEATKNVKYSSRRSAVILINIITDDKDYKLCLVENSLTSTDIRESFIESSGMIRVEQNKEPLSDQNYRYYEHRLFQKSVDDTMTDVMGLRLFIGSSTDKESFSSNNDVEVNLFDSYGSKRHHLHYNPAQGSEDFVDKTHVYFYKDEQIALMIHHDGNWYKPRSKSEYFEKWVEVLDLKGVQPNSSISSTQISSKLNDINKDLNEIALNLTSSYGLPNPTIGQLPSGFNTIRIDVIKGDDNEQYLKLTHMTKNKSTIGKIKYNDSDLKDTQEKKLSESIGSGQSSSTTTTSSGYNSVCAYYHKSDSGYERPLLLGIVKSTGTKPDVFYEREDRTNSSKWQKLQSSESSSLQGTNLEEKINKIRYTNGKSVVIKLEIQNGFNYKLQLVENTQSGSTAPVDSGGGSPTVNVTEGSCDLNESGYICLKHTINLGGYIKSLDIGGLLFYLAGNVMPVVKSIGNTHENFPIYYDPDVNEVYVYFYGHICSDIELIDDVPLLVKYNGKCYLPNSKNDYFTKWHLESSLTRGASESLKNKLDEINKMLNEIDISHTKNNNSYGLTKPTELSRDDDCNSWNRISVKVCKTDYYLRVTHSTINGFFIGYIMYNGKQTTGLDTIKSENQVCVYYQLSDMHLSTPLLICILSEGVSDSKKWFSRSNADGTQWNHLCNSNKFNDNSKIKQELISTYFKLFKSLTIKIEKQEDYSSTATIGEDGLYNGIIKIDKLNILSTYKIDKYRCCGHEVNKYYRDSKSVIKEKTSSAESELTLELVISLFNTKLLLYDKDEILSTLYYTSDDSSANNIVMVYFYEGKDYDTTDKVPLILRFNNCIYGPCDKDTYFKKWEKLDINIVNIQNTNKSIKEKLDTINGIFNEINLSEKKSYGIPCCKKHLYYKNGNFTTRRIEVTSYTNSNYSMYTHTTVNKYQIGNIKAIGDFKFEEHPGKLKDKIIDQVVVIFKKTEEARPELLLIHKDEGSGNSTTYGYYYRNNSRGDIHSNYLFNHLSRGCDLMSKLKGEEIVFEEDLTQHVAPIKSKWEEMIRDNMQKVSSPEKDDDTTGCNTEEDNELKVERCPDNVASPEPETSGSSVGQESTSDSEKVTSQSTDDSKTHQPSSPTGGQVNGRAGQAPQLRPSSPTTGTPSLSQNPQAEDTKSPAETTPQQPPTAGHDAGVPGSTEPGAAGEPHGSEGGGTRDGGGSQQESASGVGGGEPSTRPAGESDAASSEGKDNIVETLKSPPVLGGVSSGVGALALGGGGYGIYAKCIATTASSVSSYNLDTHWVHNYPCISRTRFMGIFLYTINVKIQWFKPLKYKDVDIIKIYLDT